MLSRVIRKLPGLDNYALGTMLRCDTAGRLASSGLSHAPARRDSRGGDLTHARGPVFGDNFGITLPSTYERWADNL